MGNNHYPKQESEDNRDELSSVQRLSARASGPGAAALSAEEVEEAEREAEEWARRVNRC